MSTLYSQYYKQIEEAKEFPFDLKYFGNQKKIYQGIKNWVRAGNRPYVVKWKIYKIIIDKKEN